MSWVPPQDKRTGSIQMQVPLLVNGEHPRESLLCLYSPTPRSEPELDSATLTREQRVLGAPAAAQDHLRVQGIRAGAQAPG